MARTAKQYCRGCEGPAVPTRNHPRSQTPPTLGTRPYCTHLTACASLTMPTLLRQDPVPHHPKLKVYKTPGLLHMQRQGPAARSHHKTPGSKTPGCLCTLAPGLIAALVATGRLLPPGGLTGTEVSLGPGAQGHNASLVDVSVCQGQRQGSRAADHLALSVVLGAVAWALELVLSTNPRDDAAQVGAHGVDTEVLNVAILVHHQVGWVTLQALGQRVVTLGVGLQPLGSLDVVAQGILGSLAATSTTGALGDEEQGVGHSQSTHGQADASQEDQVHGIPLGHVRHLGGDGRSLDDGH
mmetsp:Transcript_35399/g.78577  ORF Transcript_35399/g.78577 Transcript_35399/m.78577 type:complete len:297 (+) Transcript_35399:139-1029(+)